MSTTDPSEAPAWFAALHPLDHRTVEPAPSAAAVYAADPELFEAIADLERDR